jgi:hypothetical protein
MEWLRHIRPRGEVASPVTPSSRRLRYFPQEASHMPTGIFLLPAKRSMARQTSLSKVSHPRDTENRAIREERECITTAFREADLNHRKRPADWRSGRRCLLFGGRPALEALARRLKAAQICFSSMSFRIVRAALPHEASFSDRLSGEAVRPLILIVAQRACPLDGRMHPVSSFRPRRSAHIGVPRQN